MVIHASCHASRHTRVQICHGWHSLSSVADPKGREVHVCRDVSTQGSLTHGTHPNLCWIASSKARCEG
jgi:hypothetical protein